MKVVLFCGGLGMRLREYSESIPKPLVHIGARPIVWHIMKYYSYFGYNEFILCLGWKGTAIKEYFLNYNECVSNDFVMKNGGEEIDLLGSDIADWSITFVETGVSACIGERLLAVRDHLEGEEVFLANYTDGLSDLHLPHLIETFRRKEAVAAFVSVKPQQSFHSVRIDEDGKVEKFESIVDTGLWMNGGYFVLSHEIFDYIKEGEDLVAEPFQRLIEQKRLCSLAYDGFWSCMDTFKEKQDLDEMYASGNTPWEFWKNPPPIKKASGQRRV